MTLRELLKKSEDILRASGVDFPDIDARLLLEASLELPEREQRLHLNDEISKEKEEKSLAFINRRAEGEPLQYITGYWEFFSQKFFVGKGVLIPRDDTEVVLRASLEFPKNTKKNNLRILDICSGSGILAITLKNQFPSAEVTAIEISEDALLYLRKNTLYHNADIEIVEGDLFEKHKGFSEEHFDLIISNPPYITGEDMKALQKEVLFEPELALFGGEDGCDFIRGIVSLYTKKLRKGGMLALELDAEEALYTAELMKDAGYESINILDDLGGIHRAVTGIRST